MADKILQIGDGTDSNHGIRAKLAVGDRDLRYNATSGKWEATNDGSTFFDIAGGTLFPNAVNTSNNAYRVICADLDNPDLMWDLPRFLQLARNTSWYDELGSPPIHGYILVNNAQTELIWWDRVANSAYMTFETSTSDALEIGSGALRTAFFLDGKIYATIGSTGNGVRIIDLLEDGVTHYGTAGHLGFKGNISDRNDPTGWYTYDAAKTIAHDSTEDVVAYRDPNGLTDAHGRNKQWWAVATAGGVSVYNPADDAVYDAVTTAVTTIAIAKDGTLIWAGSGNGTVDLQHSITKNTADAIGIDAQYYHTASAGPYPSSDMGTPHLAVLSGRSVAQQGSNLFVLGMQTAAGGGNAHLALNLIHENKKTKTDGGVAYITGDYNGPYMKGEVKGAWPLQSNALDVCKNGHDLTNNNAVTFNASGVYGTGAADFVAASSQYLSLANHADFTFVQSFSASCWFYRDLDSGAVEYIIQCGNNTDYNFYLALTATDILQAGVRNTNPTNVVANGPLIATGRWYHAAFTYDGANIRLYVNGELITTSAQTGNMFTPVGDLRVGAGGAATPTAFWDGRIQNVCVTASVLTENEVEYEYRRGIAALASSVNTADNLVAGDIDSVSVDELGGYIGVCAGDTAHILDSGGIPVIEDAAPAGTLYHMALTSMPGSTSPHYALGTSTRLELVQGVVETRQQKSSGGAISPRIMHGPTKYLGQHSLKAYDAIVDINGNGDYYQIDEAIDAGAKDIYIREGTYDPCTVDVAEVRLTGANWDTIIDGTTTAHAIAVSAADVVIQNLSVKTTGGGGQSYDGISVSSGGDNIQIRHVHIPGSDYRGINLSAPEGLIQGCFIAGSDGSGIIVDSPRCRIIGNYINNVGGTYDDIDIGASGDNFLITGNHCEGGITIHADAEDGLCVANVINEAISDSSATSTVANNEVY